MSVTVKYKGSAIAELTDNGTKTLTTSGKYCEADIVIENTKDGGSDITDGIAVKARDADGYATDIDFYGTQVYPYQFYGGSAYSAAAITPFIKLKKLNTKNPLTEIKAFGLSNLPELTTQGLDLSNVVTISGMGRGTGKNAGSFDIILPACETIGANCFDGGGVTKISAPICTRLGNAAFQNCTRLTEAVFPHVQQIGTYTARMFQGCTALVSLTVGSIGYGVSGWGADNYKNCTQEGLTITMYAVGEKVDSLLANIRNGATNATIIIKASEATTYNGADYAAGDTIVTSEVTA